MHQAYSVQCAAIGFWGSFIEVTVLLLLLLREAALDAAAAGRPVRL